jgi:2Fe-2S ferredoxin
MNTIHVTWITRDDRRISGEVPIGHTMMDGGVRCSVDGIVGECGGAMACGTCHVHVEETPVSVGDPSMPENDMLDMLDVPRAENSRLSCQIRATAELDGLVLRVP